VIPFAGILLSIALFPLMAPRFWHHHYGKIALGWALLFLVPFSIAHGVGEATEQVLHVYVLEFIPFIILLWALYTIAGGIRLRGRLRGTPTLNVGLLALGTVLASWMGTTGAAMLIIRPLIRANAWRQRKTHLVVFFIFLVANIGGALTPLGDPPLFLGFLLGVDFFWTTTHLFLPMVLASGILLSVFFVMDRWLLGREAVQEAPDDGSTEKLGLEGTVNFLLLAGVVAAILYSGSAAKTGPYWDQSAVDARKDDVVAAEAGVQEAAERLAVASEKEQEDLVRKLLVARADVNLIRADAEHHAVKGLHITEGVTWPFVNLVRDGVLILLGVLSLVLTPWAVRRGNEFTWFPIVEVGKLFAGIFITIIPAIAILKAGPDGALSSVVMAVTDRGGNPVNAMYFWLTGGLSSFLDNAPTYLVFFNTAGGNPAVLQTAHAQTLLAISAGAVFMGANTYIGNAPNFMVRSIAEEAGVSMPSFFGYLLKWSIPFLVPVFVLVTLLWF
jgi:Na+/H+ antiporter NhaD/arsenite permease-like protein